MTEPLVEIAQTKFYGWGWHCYRCDLTMMHLDSEEEAETSAAMHRWQSGQHRAVGEADRAGPVRVARTWAMPPEPGPEVKAVRDDAGLEWRRTGNQHEGHALWRPATGAPVMSKWFELIRRGPLTEVVEP